MTGGGDIASTLPYSGIPAQPSVHRAAVGVSSYSVDSFVEYSSSAISRQRAGGRTLSPQLEEELFRDLFGGENEPESKSIDRKSQLQARSSCGMKWTTGATMVAPFQFPQKPQEKRPANFGTNNHVEMPKLNLSELVIPRPSIEDPSAAVGPNGRRPSLLGQVVEEVCESDEEEDRPETDLQSDTFPPYKPSHLNGAYSYNNNAFGKNSLEQETLRFLERLDLKTVLHTPRPEVDSFLPSAKSNEQTPRTASETLEREEYDACKQQIICQRPAPPALGPLKEPSHHRPLPKSARKESDLSAASRLAYMESTYGTKKYEPRKARRETIDRLANPIAGYTATLQALSPEQRRKREGALTNSQDAASTEIRNCEKRSPTRVLVPAASSLLDELTNASNVYHIAAVSAGKSLTVPAIPDHMAPFQRKYTPKVVITNNQIEDELSSVKTARSGKSNGKRSNSVAARKQALRVKIREREESRSNHQLPVEKTPEPARDWAASCSTFLTQQVEEEVELSQSIIDSHRTDIMVAKTASQTPRAPSGPRRFNESCKIPDISKRKHPNRPARIIPQDASRVSASTDKKDPHPPSRMISNNPDTAAARRQKIRPSQATKRIVPPTKLSARPTQPNNAIGRGRNRTYRPTSVVEGSSRAIHTQSSSSTGATGGLTARGQTRPGRKPLETMVPANNRDSEAPSRGPRVRLVPSRHLSNGVQSSRVQTSTPNAENVQSRGGGRTKPPTLTNNRGVSSSTMKIGRKPARISNKDKTVSTKTKLE